MAEEICFLYQGCSHHKTSQEISCIVKDDSCSVCNGLAMNMTLTYPRFRTCIILNQKPLAGLNVPVILFGCLPGQRRVLPRITVQLRLASSGCLIRG
ncbi:hypothetical protein HAX54_011618 [Datura stramonium]|uniref:Uncharacterized protein n=1 Tax=Datura stramonium TaxID=4076 RepID=A0ABS8TK00_DATST|nr:hypothetical protein [Datura stramonium]